MLAVLTLSSLLVATPAKAFVAYDQVTEVIGKLAASAKEAEGSNVKLMFNDGATVVGGVLTQGGSLTWNFTAVNDSPYMIYKGAYGNDTELTIDVKTGGASVVGGQNEYGAPFMAEKGKRYAVTLTNKGAETFSGMAMFKMEGGIVHPIASMSRAAKVMATSIDTSLKDGFKITKNASTLLGFAIPAGKRYNRATSKAANWTTIATTGKAAEIRLSVLNKAQESLQDDSGEAADSVCVFRNQVVESGTIRIENPTSKTVFVLSMGTSR